MWLCSPSIRRCTVLARHVHQPPCPLDASVQAGQGVMAAAECYCSFGASTSPPWGHAVRDGYPNVPYLKPREHLHSHSPARNLSGIRVPRQTRQRACDRLAHGRVRLEPTSEWARLVYTRHYRGKQARLSWCAGGLGWQCSSRHSRHLCFVELRVASRPAQVGRLIGTSLACAHSFSSTQPPQPVGLAGSAQKRVYCGPLLYLAKILFGAS